MQQASPKIHRSGRTEQELVALAVNGDREAFGALYNEHHAFVGAFISYRVLNRALAEDLTSETFVKALRSIETFSWRGQSIGAWFVTIARNLIADHFKSSRFKSEVFVGEILDLDTVAPTAEDAALSALEQLIARDTVLGALRTLNPEQQLVILLRFMEQLTIAETAVRMGKKAGAVKTLQHRATVNIAKHLRPVEMAVAA